METLLLFTLFISSHGVVVAQNSQPNGAPSQDVRISLRPSIAVVIGVFSIMFSLTFLLLIYARFCRLAGADLFTREPGEGPHDRSPDGLLSPRSRFSGIDKTVIESLPFFRFSSLRGAREGLECAVCLSRFEDAEVLRLLPKCKHAFHIDCVDRWLENHSSCPLCRCRVEVEDLTLFKYSTSSRSLFRNPSVPREETELDLYVEREPAAERSPPSSRFAWGGSFRKTDRGRKENNSKKKEVLLLEEGLEGGGQFLHKHKHKHRIVFSDVVFKNRWSDVNSADLISLKSEMINLLSSKRFSAVEYGGSERYTVGSSGQVETRSPADETVLKIKEEMDRKRTLERKASHINSSLTAPATASLPSSSEANIDLKGPSATFLNSMIPSCNSRCMSEIVNVSRFDYGRSRGTSDDTSAGNGSRKDEKMRRLWLPIARRTVQWFAGREKRPETTDQRTRTASNV